MNYSSSQITWSIPTSGNTHNHPLLLLHGFAGSHRYWNSFLPELEKSFYVITPDLPGHGDSRLALPCDLNWIDIVDGLMKVLDTITSQPFTIVGYSMGARFAMHLVTRYPNRFTRAMFISGSAGFSSEKEKVLRLSQDCELANRIVNNGMEWFADFWERLPMFRNRRQLPEFERNSLREEWLKQNPQQLSAGLLLLSVGRQEYLIDKLKNIHCPLCFIVGKEDEKYASLLSGYSEMLPASEVELISNCGHDVPREKPELFLSILNEFVQERKIK